MLGILVVLLLNNVYEDRYFMSSKSFDLLIIYHSGDKKIVKRVNNYGVSDSARCFYYEKNGYHSFVPVSQVQFLGMLFDYEEA